MSSSSLARTIAPLLLCALPGLAGCGQDDTQAVRDCFYGYKNAVLEADGTTAVGFVDDTTLQYYGHLLDTVLHANYVTMGEQSILDQLTALQMRLIIPAEALRDLTPKTLIAEAVERGIGKEAVEDADLGTVFVTGDIATGGFLSKGQETPYKYVFYRTDSGWKIDLTSVNVPANEALDAAVLGSGKPTNEFIKTVLGGVSGKTVTDALWVPVGR